jgi:hypothetical protein
MDVDYLNTSLKAAEKIDDYEETEFHEQRDTDSDQEPSNQDLTAKTPAIYDALLTLKRVCQIHLLKFD